MAPRTASCGQGGRRQRREPAAQRAGRWSIRIMLLACSPGGGSATTRWQPAQRSLVGLELCQLGAQRVERGVQDGCVRQHGSDGCEAGLAGTCEQAAAGSGRRWRRLAAVPKGVRASATDRSAPFCALCLARSASVAFCWAPAAGVERTAESKKLLQGLDAPCRPAAMARTHPTRWAAPGPSELLGRERPAWAFSQEATYSFLRSIDEIGGTSATNVPPSPNCQVKGAKLRAPEPCARPPAANAAISLPSTSRLVFCLLACRAPRNPERAAGLVAAPRGAQSGEGSCQQPSSVPPCRCRAQTC